MKSWEINLENFLQKKFYFLLLHNLFVFVKPSAFWYVDVTTQLLILSSGFTTKSNKI
jgi:hypothetical protein